MCYNVVLPWLQCILDTSCVTSCVTMVTSCVTSCVTMVTSCVTSISDCLSVNIYKKSFERM